jgi:hypothetical protein
VTDPASFESTYLTILYRYLGGETSATSGHAISFEERRDKDHNPAYCTKNGNRNTWNSNLSNDTVPIEWTRGTVALTQTGKP